MFYFMSFLCKDMCHSLTKKQHICMRYYSPYNQSHLIEGQASESSGLPLPYEEPISRTSSGRWEGAALVQSGLTAPGLHRAVPRRGSAPGILGDHASC